jgi:hypothetical protein
MSAGNVFFVDSNLLLYYVDPLEERCASKHSPPGKSSNIWRNGAPWILLWG